MTTQTHFAEHWWRALRRLCAASLVATATTAFAAQPAGDTERNRRFIDAAFERWAAGGSGFFDEVLGENTVWTIKGSSPSAATHRGRTAFVEKAVKPFAARMASPVKPVSRQVWADGERVAGDGKPYHNSYVWIFRMAGGRALDVTAYLDLPAYDDVLRRVTLKEEKK